MADGNVLNNAATLVVPFGLVPVQDNHLFDVRGGMDCSFAVSEAQCLEESVRKLLTEAVAYGGMGAETSFLCRFALDAAQALRRSAGQEA